MLAIPIAALALIAGTGFRDQSAQAEKNEDASDVAEAIIDLENLAQRLAEERLTIVRVGFSDNTSASSSMASEFADAVELTDAQIEGILEKRQTISEPIVSEIAASLDSARNVNSTAGLDTYAEALSDITRAIESQPLTGFSADAVLAIDAMQDARDVVNTQESAWASYFENTPGDLTPQEVLPVLLENRAEWTDASTNAATLLENQLDTQANSINDERSLFTLFAVLGSLLLFTLVFVIGRSILGPLGRLLEHADVMTNERLPFAVAKLRTLGSSDELPELRPIPRESDDEIGLLVDAFNDVQDTAVKVATDQARSRRNVAEMFVSLGRRNQQLNHRMINLISDLERDEQDPKMLAGLYQLDHLATRMRRNAESLLVLAGNRSPRQWSRPVPIEDVVRSSLGEVELFERIDIGDLPEVAMQGNVVTDVTHLLAELLDNATQFSEPSTSVSISAQETLEGVEIEVFDEGFGIGEQDLVELNERVTNPPALDEAPSRLLGLFVVGRLAQQHGIDVELQSQPGVGTVATIAIPNALFAEVLPDPDADGAPSALGTVAVPVSGEDIELDALAGVGVAEPAGFDPVGLPPSDHSPVGLEPVESADLEPVVEQASAPDAPAAGEPLAQRVPIEPVSIAPAEPTVVEPVAMNPADFGQDVSDAEAAALAASSWAPAAVHEEELADAAMPTMEEVEEALPSFPGVTIDTPETSAADVPSPPVVSDDTWPLTKLDPVEAPDEASMAAIDSIPDPTLAPSSRSRSPRPFRVPLRFQQYLFRPCQPYRRRNAPSYPRRRSSTHRSLRLLRVPLPHQPHPRSNLLPHQRPDADVTPELIPLGDPTVDAPAPVAPASSSAFAAFATGVNRGLKKVEEDPNPKFSEQLC